MPNVPYSGVPEGKTAEDNVVEKTGGKMPELGEDALPHWDLAKKYNLIDFDLGVKITGAGFPVYVGKGARLQRALIQFFLDEAGKAGYLEIEPPLVVNEASGLGTGQLPDKEGQMYHCQVDNFYLIPTAEVPVTNLYRDVIIPQEELPKKNCAYSACFRREAGSYGKDVRGLNRLHQFDKVEIVRIEKPENSYAALEEMKDHVQHLLDELELPWHILRLCGGEVGWHDKSYCMTASYSKAVLHNSLKRNQRTMVAVPVYGAAQRGHYKENGLTEQHIEIRNDGKSNCLTTVQKDSLICKPVRIGEYGKGGQGQRIYSVHGKSVTLSANGGGQGAKTGLYKIDLPDGEYMIRKLTPVEAERLQTLPDNYTDGISNTQRYKCIGNAWTVDVIAHILKGIL